MRLVKGSMEPGLEAWKFGSLEPWRVLHAQEQEREKTCMPDGPGVYSKYRIIGQKEV